jgi:hypothetical protein
LWKQIGARDRDLVPGLLDPRRSRLEVVAAAERLDDQRLERGIAEDRPPGKVGERGRLGRTALAARRIRDRDARAPVPRSDRARRDDGQREDGGEPGAASSHARSATQVVREP